MAKPARFVGECAVVLTKLDDVRGQAAMRVTYLHGFQPAPFTEEGIGEEDGGAERRTPPEDLPAQWDWRVRRAHLGRTGPCPGTKGQ